MAKTNGNPLAAAAKPKDPPKKKKKKPVKHAAKKEDNASQPPKHSMAWRGKLKLEEEKAPEETAIVPYTLQKIPKLYWPSSLFFNASYPKGILVHPKSKEEYFAPHSGYSNDTVGDRTMPCLSSVEARLWCQKHAAHTAVARRFPVEVGRLLGTITLEIQQVKKKKGKGKTDPNALVPESLREMENKLRIKSQNKPFVLGRKDRRDPNQVKRISAKQATDEASVECRGQARDEVLKRSQEIQEQWRHIQNCGPYPEAWDPADGSYKVGSDDEQFVTLKALQAWLAKGIKAGTLKDKQEGDNNELYGGLIKVPIGATDVIDELVSLANPKESIYGVPLICAYPRMTKCPGDVWKIQLGVYMHRLLPEIFTCQSLHIIMSALDDTSYQVSEPICLPPSGPEVFKSAAYPKVDTSLLDGDGDKSVSDSDSDMEGGSRDELLISPFKVKGLLKLLENKGCDVSNWPKIERELRGKFQLDLLLHQQHAICWMIQMEHLEGAYGINSLLWEQRTFPDGGHYYYSPALGQVRLGAPPPRMKGGLLCDEQGLGKTVCVLGLIMATLPELKKRLDKKNKATTKYDGDEYYSAESADDDEYAAHSTLIIVPPALLAQWVHEVEKAVGKTTLSVSMLVAQTGELKTCLPPPAKDCDESVDDIDDYDRVLASDVVITTYDALDKPCCSRVLQSVQWGRVVLDEMQEIRSSTTKIAKNCEKLQCDRRWMLSGTPIYSGIEDLRGELNFLRLEPFGAAWEDGFFDFAIQKPWESKEPHAVAVLQVLCFVALRRSKDMTIVATGSRLLDLKKMTVEFCPVPQTHSERALYCWMEYLVACELELTKAKKRKGEAVVFTTKATEKANTQSRAQCLRLLRELCITPMLLNGGMGAQSQLKTIDRLKIRHNQREQQNGMTRAHESHGIGGGRNRNEIKVMSCDQAQRFLTQHQQAARTGEEFVTDMAFGGGRGVSNRDRAEESPQERYDDAKADVASAEKVLSALAKKRAKAHWHLALENVTTGHVSDGRTHKFSGLWKWRRLVCAALDGKSKVRATRESSSKQKFPHDLLTRGWRPSEDFLEGDLYARHPKWSWSHPHALLVTNIPKEVSQKELATAMRDAAKRVPLAKKEKENCSAQLLKLKQSKHKSKSDSARRMKELEAKLQQIDDKMNDYKKYDSNVKLPTVVKVCERKNAQGFWKATLQVGTEEQKASVLALCARSTGASISSKRSIPHIKALIEGAKENVSFADAENKVYPSAENKKRLTTAKKELEKLSNNMGLRAVTVGNASMPAMSEDISNEAGTSHPYMLVANAVGGQLRTLAPRTANALVDSAATTLQQAATDMPKLKAKLERGQRVMKMFERCVRGKVSPQVAQLTAYETLEAMREGETETKTQCVICLGYLGQAEEDAQTQARDANRAGKKRKRGNIPITMINCGHFYCTQCVRLLVSTSGSKCAACRKTFLLSETIQVDIDLKDEEVALKKEREAAKALVREAGKLLTESDGHLEADMWRALYLAFDLPTGVPRLGSQSFPAIPRDVLMHLRAACGVPPNMSKTARPPPGSLKGAARNSKVQALLNDLPTKERCVVFSANRDCLLHLAEVFTDDKIGFQLLCTGLSTSQSRDAVTNWERDGDSPSDGPPFPVLLVHAGAASAGLTLTAAARMFIMEPFLKQEQEHQAYSRCHRYGQEHKVNVKVYYTPVSVESRLLEWRKSGKSALIASKDKEAEECNFEENTEIIIHEMDEDSDDESSDSESESGNKKNDNGEGDDDTNQDVAQANFLLGLVD